MNIKLSIKQKLMDLYTAFI